MAFFDQVKGKITQASQTTMQKAKDLSEVAKLNSAVSDAENKISELYAQIGFEVYKAYHANPLPEVAEQISKITELHGIIESCNEQIKTINAANICPQCGSKVRQGMAFCSNCGYKLPAVAQPAERDPNTIVCGKCGEVLPVGAMFCTSCGNKMNG